MNESEHHKPGSFEPRGDQESIKEFRARQREEERRIVAESQHHKAGQERGPAELRRMQESAREKAALDRDAREERLAALVARIREMAEDYKMLMDFTMNVKGGPHYDEWRPMMKKWEERIGIKPLEPFLSAAPYLLAMIEPEAAKAGEGPQE